mgnify:CR=1 FL=1
MSYSTTNKTQPIHKPSNRIGDVAGVRSTLLGLSKFYEIEVGEVIDVIYNQDDDEGTQYGTAVDVNKIQVRLLSSQRNVDTDDLKWIQPIDVSIRKLPLIGELVLVYDLHGNFFYGNTLCNLGDVNLNLNVNMSLDPKYSNNSAGGGDYDEVSAGGAMDNSSGEFKVGNYFKEDKDIHPTKQYEGDVIIEGRFGNSIRFGSNITEKKGDDETPKENSPNIILKTGQLFDAEKHGNASKVEDLKKKYLLPVDDDINDDGSSVWITTDQKIDLKPATEEEKLSHFISYTPIPEKYDGKQIVLNSDRIIFNSKENDIFGFAKKGISFMTDGIFAIDNTKTLILNTEDKINLKAKSDIISKTDTKFEVDSPKINLGADAVEPVALGNQLKTCLELICDAIETGTYSGGGGVHVWSGAGTIPVRQQIANILSSVSKTK